MDKDLKPLVKWAESQGWSITTDADGYTRFYAPDGSYVVRYPASPSNPRRRLMDVKVALRANGLEIPPPSKAVQRARAKKEEAEKEEGK